MFDGYLMNCRGGVDLPYAVRRMSEEGSMRLFVCLAVSAADAQNRRSVTIRSEGARLAGGLRFPPVFAAPANHGQDNPPGRAGA